MPSFAYPYSQRTTCAVAVFGCLSVASPQGAQRFAVGNAATIGALQSEYEQLLSVYRKLRRQDVANQRIDLVAAVAQAVTIISSLSATLQSMTAVGDAGIALANFQIIAANALVQVTNVKFDESQ